MTNSVGEGLPLILGAIAVLILGFFIAGLIRRLVKRLLGKTSIDDKLAARMNTSVRIDAFIAQLAYYLIVIYTLLIVLNMLGVDSVLVPLQNMVNEFLGYIPNIVGAGIIAFAGYIIAQLVSEATGFISERIEAFGAKAGFSAGTLDLPKLIKQLVFILVFIPILIIALDKLNFKAISEPAIEMLSQFFNAIPKIIAAGVLLAIFYVVGKYITSMLTELLSNLGLDRLAANMGLEKLLGNTSLSTLIGNVVLFFIIFLGILAAADKLGLGQIEIVLTEILIIAGRVFFGLAILLGGVYVSNLATRLISETNGSWMASLVRFAIMGIFVAFALSTMGVAESIVNLAFGLILGAIAVAFALAFGLGGREAAGKQLQRFFDKLNNDK